ncbi:b(0,+)-type amino acid transporter 1-like isoform X1 [Biomphalaria glabrata]|uniref:b(0,+)-type amino acid transporter 1 n=2 Tax=Biomphalaria glabrata TaxID=6526 RepID=A0A9W3AVS4_BIOGL|nr:b(0,+)-type amino acid transporter 1-like isoform X1 [Biomphalaria glabrata]
MGKKSQDFEVARRSMDMQRLDEDDSSSSAKNEKVGLKRDVGLISGIALIIGTMIGSGIFISPKGMIEGCGSVGLTLILWCLCGLLTTMGALSYAELGTMIPESGGEHAYLMYTFNKVRKNKKPIYKLMNTQGSKSFARVPAFLYDWVALFIIRPTMYAIMAMALGTYAVKPFYPDCPPPDIAVKLVTAVAMCTIAFINSVSVKAATMVQNITTFTKLIALAIISVGGIIMIFKGNTEYLSEGFEGTRNDPQKVAIAFYNGLWAFDGWNSLNFITEELKNPTRNLPRAIMIGIPLTTLCYVLANVGYLAVMSKEEIMISHAVAVTWGERMLGVMSWMIPCFVVASTFGSANGCLFSSGRLCFSAGRDGHFPRILSFLQFDRNTPMPAVMFTLIISLCLIIPGDLSSLIDFFSFASWLFYGITTASLLILRVIEPKTPRPYKVPLPVPIIVLLASIYLVIAPIIQNPGIQFVYAVLFILSGLIIYIPFIYMGIHFKFMDKITIVLQKLLRVAPTDKAR